MCELTKLTWFSGSGGVFSYEDMVKIIESYIKKGSKIFIGSDSFIAKRRVNFATAICLYGGTGSTRYFFAKERIPKKRFNVMSSRITEEARRSVVLAEHLKTFHHIRSQDIELHLDVSPTHLKNGTSKLSDMLRGYVTGAGFKCRVKPEAWASQTVADKHSK